MQVASKTKSDCVSRCNCALIFHLGANFHLVTILDRRYPIHCLKSWQNGVFLSFSPVLRRLRTCRRIPSGVVFGRQIKAWGFHASVWDFGWLKQQRLEPKLPRGCNDFQKVLHRALGTLRKQKNGCQVPGVSTKREQNLCCPAFAFGIEKGGTRTLESNFSLQDGTPFPQISHFQFDHWK